MSIGPLFFGDDLNPAYAGGGVGKYIPTGSAGILTEDGQTILTEDGQTILPE